MLSKLLYTDNVSLDTDPTAVTAPTTLARQATTVVVAAEASESFVTWERQAASDSTYSAKCRVGKESLEIAVNPGQTIFYAKVLADTATLDVEYWG